MHACTHGALQQHGGCACPAAAGWGFASFEAVVDAWYNEVNTYTYGSDTLNHFTQMVWKSTTELGCGVTDCDGTLFHVCNYNPPGALLGGGARACVPHRAWP